MMTRIQAKTSTIVVLAVFIGMFLLSGTINAQDSPTGTEQGKPVKLTILLPFTGVLKDLAIHARNGFFLGIEQESSNLGVDFAKWVEFEMLDSRLDGKHSLPLVKKSVADGSQAILGIISSEVGMTIADYVLNEAKIPLFVFGVAGTSALRTSNPLFLRITSVTSQESLGPALWSQEHPPVPNMGRPLRWACIYADYQPGVDFCGGFKLGYEQFGEEIGRIPVPFKTVNKRKYLLQLSKLEPDFATAFFAGMEIEAFVQDYYRFQLHKSIPLLILGSALTPHALKTFEETLDQYETGIGILNVIQWTPEVDNPESQTFVKLYQKKYSSPPAAFAMYSYDAGRLLVKVLAELNGKWDHGKVMQLMRTLPLQSPRHGEQLKFDSHGDLIVPMRIFITKREGDRLVNELVDITPFINMDDYIE